MPLTILDRLERRFGRFAIPNLTVILIAGQALTYFAANLPKGTFLSEPAAVPMRLALIPQRVLEGEWWRLITFAFTPPATLPIFVIFYFMLFYLFGTSLELHWGAFRYNLFLLTGYVANLAGAFIALAFLRESVPGGEQMLELGVFTNTFLYGSLFLAFARLYPDFMLSLFFVLPIKIKWLALVQAIFYFITIVTGDWMTRMAALTSLANYLLFFGAGHVRQAKYVRRRQEFYIKAKKSTAKPRHECAVCGVTSDDSPKLLFRYCSKCAGQQCYCPEHIANHEHVTEEELAGK